MITQNLIILLQETAFSFKQKQAQECYRNLGCGCANPGKALQCEGCPYLEACLSHAKIHKGKGNY